MLIQVLVIHCVDCQEPQRIGKKKEKKNLNCPVLQQLSCIRYKRSPGVLHQGFDKSNHSKVEGRMAMASLYSPDWNVLGTDDRGHVGCERMDESRSNRSTCIFEHTDTTRTKDSCPSLSLSHLHSHSRTRTRALTD